MILKPDGSAYQPPEILTREEMYYLERALGLNKRGSGKLTRNEFRIGRPTQEQLVFFRGMMARNIIALYVDGRGMGKKAVRALKEGDLTKGVVCLRVTDYGGKCFMATVRDSEAKMKMANEAERA